MIDCLVTAMVRFAQRTPYEHLYHADGTLYMGRWWLLQPRWWTLGIAVRVHHIATPDLDRHLHDHPWPFLSIVLRGWYVESRPISRAPCFREDADEEICYLTQRHAGSVAYRASTDRHRIIHLSQESVWTVVITGPKSRTWWGFFTRAGKIYWRDYPSVHETGQA